MKKAITDDGLFMGRVGVLDETYPGPNARIVYTEHDSCITAPGTWIEVSNSYDINSIIEWLDILKLQGYEIKI